MVTEGRAADRVTLAVLSCGHPGKKKGKWEDDEMGVAFI